ncbi:hypothetical protein NUACC26_085960 [Scytonema sp. NUACC26]
MEANIVYVRKTKDEYKIMQYTGFLYGWEEVCCEYSKRDAKETLSIYRQNQPEYPVKIVKKRVKVNGNN